MGLELNLIFLRSAQRPPRTVVRVPVIRLGIADIVWDVNGIKDEYTGKRRRSQCRFFDTDDRKRRWPMNGTSYFARPSQKGAYRETENTEKRTSASEFLLRVLNASVVGDLLIFPSAPSKF